MYGDKTTPAGKIAALKSLAKISPAAKLIAATKLSGENKTKREPIMEGSEVEVGPSGPQNSEKTTNVVKTSSGNAKTRKEKVDRKPSMGTLRRKAARTAKFWGKQLGVTQPLSNDLIDAAALMGSISNTSYHTPSIVVGMMVALRYTTSPDAKVKTEVLSALKRWTK